MKCDHILFPTDFSDHCRALAAPVAQLANLFDSRLTLLHVADIPSTCYTATEAYYDWDTFRGLADRIKRQLHDFPMELPASRVERTAIEGDPAHQIIDYAKRHKVDLIAMGTHGCGTLRGLLLGSVAERVLREASCTVWIHSTSHPAVTMAAGAVRNIICALDLTETAVPVLSFTGELAARTGAYVVVVHSVSELETSTERHLSPSLREFLLETARQQIMTLQQKAGTDFPVSLSGEGIAKAIVTAAREQPADMVIIGRGKCQRTLGRLRTHAYDIVRQTPCSVLSYAEAPVEAEQLSTEAEHSTMSA